jgi:predicted metal-binding membrane protein
VAAHPGQQRSALRLTPAAVAVLLLAAALVTWIVAVQQMRGMDAGPGTDLGALGWFVGLWVTMMAAMMLPSAAPMILLFHRVSTEQAKREQPSVPTWVFILSYLAVWTAYGLAAYGLYQLLASLDTSVFGWERGGRWLAGSAIAAAGLYELTPLKSVCLRQCRSPLHFVLGRWRNGVAGAVHMGAEHGTYCVGCCWGLMVVLFALGVMSLTWMAAVAGLIFAEKVLPRGQALTRVLAVAFVAGGIWVAVAPGSVPGLTLPNSDAADRARERMTGMRPSGGMPMGPAPAKAKPMHGMPPGPKPMGGMPERPARTTPATQPGSR